MLTSLSIKNYALIEDLQVEFEDGLSIITGETGAGKSILLGGLNLVLGKRADSALVYKKEQKCVIEAIFDVENYNLQSFFEEYDLDFDPHCILRREVLPHGKSRAFINDTPVNLTVLKLLSEQLIDIHSQHETGELASVDYQFRIVDSMAENQENLRLYRQKKLAYEDLLESLRQEKEKQARSRQEYDYNLFVLKELKEANLETGEQELLEQELEKLSHLEEIMENLSESFSQANDEQFGLLSGLIQVNQRLLKIAGFSESYQELSDRMNSLLLEFQDLSREMEIENSNLVHEPFELTRVEERLGLIYDLQRKHLVDTVDGLLGVRSEFEEKVRQVDDSEEILQELEEACNKAKEGLISLASEIRKHRLKAVPKFVSSLEKQLVGLEMKNTRLQIKLTALDEPGSNGMDRLEFLLSSDKGKSYEKISKAASGGEMSRIMLAVKHILSAYSKLPAIIFDEIDSGVSGEVSKKIADNMRAMSRNMQVISITHLPQVAARGKQHYKVYKKEEKGAISTNIMELNKEERLVELAEMLGGSNLTESAIAHARQLLS